MTAPSQAALVAWFDARGGERADTHGAHVFLIGDRAYKLKRAIDYGYMDFSSADKRHGALTAELLANRRFAPALYRRVIPVTVEGAGFALDGAGEIVDWLLEMRRFDRAGQLDRLARTAGLTRDIGFATGAAIGGYHRGAPLRRHGGDAVWLRRVAEVNLAACADHAQRLGPERVAALRGHLLAAIDHQSGRVDARRRAGAVVRGHGDLHLRNLVWQDGAPLLFDAIEFSDLFAVCDRLYDLAFAPMDAWCHGQHDAANAMLNGWLAVTGDHDGLDLLPLFLALRAMIRVHAAASEGDLAAAARYLDAAFGFLAPAPPSLMAVGGLSGSGKSYRAHRLAPGLGAAPGAVVLRSDAIRKELAGVPADERLPPEAYTVEAGEIVYAELRARAADCLARGRAVIADAVHARSEQRAAIEAVARAAGVPFIGEWLTVAPDVAAARLDARRGDVSDGDRRVLNQQLTYDLGEITWRSLDATA